MTPCLPQNDSDAGARADALANTREDYTFVYDYHDIVSVKSLPLRDETDPCYWAAILEVTAELELNKLGIWAKGGPGEGFESYAKLYATIPTPEIVAAWGSDEMFAWQAVAGANPVMLRRFTRADARFPITEAHYARAVVGDTLAAAMSEGRLYLADYAALDGLAEGQIGELKKYNFAPIALYAWQPKLNALVAVAIQCGQTPGTANPIYTPADGVSWRMARNCLNVADGNYQGVVSHFAVCHQVMESVILCAYRQLAANHPLLQLLKPHFDNTLITNKIAMTNLIGPAGYMDRLQSPTLEASLALSTRSIAEFRLTESAPAKVFAARGVDDADTLRDYPARDDSLLIWAANQPFIDDYVRLYYGTDADVAGDTELRAWVAEMGARDGGRLNGIACPQTVLAVVELIAQIVFRCTAYHASINYSSFELFSYPPNLQAAGFGPGPTGGPTDTEAAWLAMLPPFSQASDALYLFYEICKIQLNRIGDYPDGHFEDARVEPLLSAYKARLDDVERTIIERNRTRRFAYPFQLPSRISRSIHV